MQRVGYRLRILLSAAPVSILGVMLVLGGTRVAMAAGNVDTTCTNQSLQADLYGTTAIAHRTYSHHIAVTSGAHGAGTQRLHAGGVSIGKLA